jgi:hypothetical protein
VRTARDGQVRIGVDRPDKVGTMNDICTYLIELRGQIDESEINRLSPLSMTLERVDLAATRLRACSDQSGLIGLMRHLHGLGFVFLSVSRVDKAGVRENEPGN